MGLLIALGLMVIGVLVLQARQMPPGPRAAFLKRLIAYAAIVGLVILTATGRLHWLALAIAALVPIASRLLGLLRFAPLFAVLFRTYEARKAAKANANDDAGTTSEVTSDYLHMRLDHASGVMSGLVRKGAFEGRALADLTRDQLLGLLLECQQQDPESASLLRAYLDREHSDWHEYADNASEPHNRHSNKGTDGNQSKTTFGSNMSRAEAAEILGVPEDASAADIRAAHRRLMQRLHPDRGGSTFLAAKINEAKDRLMDS